MRYLLLLSFLVTTFSFGELNWKSVPIKVKPAKVGEMYEDDISQYTNNPTASGIIVGLRNPPTWLEMVKNANSNQVILKSKVPVPASEMGKTLALRFDLSSSIDGGILDQPGELFVQWAPVWNPAGTINLGNFEEGKSRTVDLLKFLTNAEKVTNLKITVTIPPQYPWITFDNNHTLTIAPPGGAPNHPNVGPFKDIILTATADGGTDTATGIGNVDKVITPPSWLPINLVNATEDMPYEVKLADPLPNGFLMHPEGTPGICGFVTGFAHSWLQISNSCTLFGTPNKTHLKLPKTARIFFATVIDGKSYRTEAEISVTIDHVNHKPTWNVKEIDFGKIFTKDFFSRELINSVSDYDDDDQGKLTISIIDNVTGHTWAKMNGSKIEGTPQKPDVTSPNKARWTLRVSDPAGAFDDATVLVEVIKANEPPIWKTQNIQLPSAYEDKAYVPGGDLNPHIFDEDGDPIKCTLIKGPSWLRVTPDCLVVAGSRVPNANDVGIQNLIVKIDDNKSINGPTNDKIIVEVIHTNHPPKFHWKPIVINVTEDQPVTVDFKNYVTDQDIPKFGDSLTFKLEFIPQGTSTIPWDTSFDINTGVFQGTPKETDVPKSMYRVTATDSFGTSDSAEVHFIVKGVIKPPKWTTCPIPFPDAKERERYTFMLSNHVENKSGSKLTYFTVAGKSQPIWMGIDQSSGLVTGTPQRAHVGGPFKFTLRVADNLGNFADCESSVNVLKVPYAPYWKTTEIDLGQCIENSNCTDFDLKPWVINPDNAPLEFGKIDTQTPLWIGVTKDGIVQRVAPSIAPDAKKKFTAKFFVSDGTNKPEVNAFTNIIKRNLPPSCPAEIDSSYTVAENTTVGDNLAAKVIDPDGDRLIFNPIDFDATWTGLSRTGALALSPRHKQVTDGGLFYFNYRVTDTVTDPIECKIRVVVTPAAPQPPKWNSDPIYLMGEVNKPLRNTAGDLYQLRHYVTDPVFPSTDLTFKLVQDNGHQWLFWNAKGTLEGTPKVVGNFPFVFEVCNPSKSCTNGNVVIVVKETVKPEELEVALYENCSGSALDQFWILDNTDKCSQFMHSLRSNIRFYYSVLNSKNIYHHSLMLNAHARNWDGQPVRQLDFKGNPVRPYVMSYDHSTSQLITDFVDRTYITTNRDPDRSSFTYNNRCGGYCYNSPIWTFFRFLDKNEGSKKNAWSLNSQDFFLKNVPTEVMIITNQRDHYKTYNGSTPQKNWDPKDFVDHFIKIHKQHQKPLTISAIGPKSSKLVTDDPTLAAHENAYQILVNNTNGEYWERDCGFDVRSALEEYAKKTSQNACVFNKTKIPLKPTAKADSIQVFIGGKEYFSSSGAWTFNAVDNTVYINWSVIDASVLKPGDKILIKYKA